LKDKDSFIFTDDTLHFEKEAPKTIEDEFNKMTTLDFKNLEN